MRIIETIPNYRFNFIVKYLEIIKTYRAIKFMDGRFPSDREAYYWASKGTFFLVMCNCLAIYAFFDSLTHFFLKFDMANVEWLPPLIFCPFLAIGLMILFSKDDLDALKTKMRSLNPALIARKRKLIRLFALSSYLIAIASFILLVCSKLFS